MQRRTHRDIGRPPFETIALVLQGGGALGAYQAGAFQALHEAAIEPDWIAGISIGAINAAIIAGNAPDQRLAKLRSFWEGVTAQPVTGAALLWEGFDPVAQSGDIRRWMNGAHAAAALFQGAPGFFSPRLPPPYLLPPGTPGATSYYDTSALRGTLESLIDFDRINRGTTRLSLGAVNIRSGNFAYFDTRSDVIRPEHIMASGALPPGFPPVEIDGQAYWDGGLVSNTPLQWVAEDSPRHDTLAFQIDLWSARGELPRDLPEAAMRTKEIQFSSRTRLNTDQLKKAMRLRAALRSLLAALPPDALDGEEARLLAEHASDCVFRVVHLIYRSRHYESDSKDYEFSRRSMLEHWESGYLDAVRTLRDPASMQRPSRRRGLETFDIDHGTA